MYPTLPSLQEVASGAFPVSPCYSSVPYPSPASKQYSDFFHPMLILSLLELYISGIIVYILFLYLASLSTVFLRSILVVYSSLLLNTTSLYEYTTIHLSIVLFILLQISVLMLTSPPFFFFRYNQYTIKCTLMGVRI